MKIHFLGTGDAFGSGGRFQTCFHVRASQSTFLVDCGATSMVALRKFEVDPNEIDTIYVSHLHGDHSGGLPYFILDAHLVSRREEPLTVVGPPGLSHWLHTARELAFADSSSNRLRYELELVEVEPGDTYKARGLELETFLVKHKCSGPPLALRFTDQGKVLSYTGDTEWVESLRNLAYQADLLICESYFYEKAIPFHLNYKTAIEKRGELQAKRILLTHASLDMLQRELDFELAHDGLFVEV